jgi:hypothetical protein
MNAITIQKTHDGIFLITVPFGGPYRTVYPQGVKAIVENSLPSVVAIQEDPKHKFTTIPERLSNQAVTLKQFDGVTVERDADGKIAKITAHNTRETVGGCVITFEKPHAIAGLEPRHDSKTPAAKTPFLQFFERAQDAWHRVMEQRDEIMEAFIAKYGCQPDEIVQIQQPAWPGSHLQTWSVRKKAFTEGGRMPTHKPPFSVREAARRIMGEAREMYYASIVPTLGDNKFMTRVVHIIEEFTGHKERVIAELRKLWDETVKHDLLGDGRWITKENADQIANLLSSPPVFHAPGDSAAQIKRASEPIIKELWRDEARAMHARNSELVKERDQLAADLKLACQQRAECLLENGRLKRQEVTLSYCIGLTREAREEAKADAKTAALLLEQAWGIIANASGGNWETQTWDWQIAAAKFRDEYHAAIPGAS